MTVVKAINANAIEIKEGIGKRVWRVGRREDS